MTAYLIADIEVTDADTYEEYRLRAPDIIAAHGGRYLARGGTSALLEGEVPPKRLVVVEFPDMTQLMAFYHSAEYQAVAAIRRRAAHSRLLALEGV